MEYIISEQKLKDLIKDAWDKSLDFYKGNTDEWFDEFFENEKEQCTIHSVSKRFDDQKFIDNVIGSYRHDFGLLDKQEQDKLRFECKEWMRAIKNNEPY